MKYKLNVKLILSYLFIAFFLVGIIASVTNITFDRQFKKYVINSQEQKNQSIAEAIINEYKNSQKELYEIDFEEIGMQGLEDGLIIKISDNDNKVLWDAMEHNSGMCAQILAERAISMKEYYPNFDGEYTDKEYVLKIDDIEIGKVLIGYYGPYYFSENDILFLRTFNDILIIIVIVSIVISVLLGIILSRSITGNITNVIKMTKEIASGNYKHKIDQKTDIKEIIDLTNSVNNLATSLQRQEQLREDLTADIAHELRTPITTLQSHLEAIKDGVWELTQDRIDSLYEEIIRISKIVDDLNKLNKYDNDNIILCKNDFDIKSLLLKIITNFSSEAKENCININIKGEEKIVFADQDKIKQVFINLISNSLKYTNKGGYINICIYDEKDNINVTVEDNGIGISSKDIPFIFERFYRTDKSRARITGGSGLGLSITKKIIDAHGGRIIVDSKLNRGTKVIVILPKN